MSRSLYKLPYISLNFFKNKFKKKNNLNVQKRNSIIPAILIDKKMKICLFNGIWYLSILLSNNMLNNKLGEFSYTKRSDRQTHLKKKRKKKSNLIKK